MRSSILRVVIPLCLFISACGDEPIELGEPLPVDPKLILSERQVGIEIGGIENIAATFVTETSRTANPAVSWTVDDSSIAEVSGAGEITAKAAGQTFVRATLEGTTSYPSLITVVASMDDLARIDMVPDTLETERSNQRTLDFTAWTLAGNRIDNPDAVWSASDPSVASINQLGQAESIERGLSEISVEINGIKSLPVSYGVFGETKSGQLSGQGDYRASGEVNLVELPEGGMELRLSDSFAVDAGPRLDVYLSKTARVDGNSINLGLLRAFNGAQSFNVPGNVILSDIEFVIIHCTTYDLPFGGATVR